MSIEPNKLSDEKLERVINLIFGSEYAIRAHIAWLNAELDQLVMGEAAAMALVLSHEGHIEKLTGQLGIARTALVEIVAHNAYGRHVKAAMLIRIAKQALAELSKGTI